MKGGREGRKKNEKEMIWRDEKERKKKKREKGRKIDVQGDSHGTEIIHTHTLL